MGFTLIDRTVVFVCAPDYFPFLNVRELKDKGIIPQDADPTDPNVSIPQQVQEIAFSHRIRIQWMQTRLTIAQFASNGEDGKALDSSAIAYLAATQKAEGLTAIGVNFTAFAEVPDAGRLIKERLIAETKVADQLGGLRSAGLTYQMQQDGGVVVIQVQDSMATKGGSQIRGVGATANFHRDFDGTKECRTEAEAYIGYRSDMESKFLAALAQLGKELGIDG